VTATLTVENADIGMSQSLPAILHDEIAGTVILELPDSAGH
jgi:hypothetical protein